jgi:hypothetical protein
MNKKIRRNNLAFHVKKTLPLVLLCLLIFACTQKSSTLDAQKKTVITDSIEIKGKNNLPVGLVKLLNAYPEFLDSANNNTIYWKDGTKMQYDDGIKDKDYETLLNESDLEDQMSQSYTKGADWDSPPPINFEPGRIRYEPFFLKMYGNNPSEVKEKLVNVKWVDGTTFQFSSVNGASDRLKEVITELEQLGVDFQKYLKNIGGTFNWRNIAGTDRLSVHSFGTAIDISTKFSDYWQWDKSMTYKNRIPFEIVEVFERHGFIWGGKWYHYDTMHFEYRPELLIDNN